jgi:hypothetical protein
VTRIANDTYPTLVVGRDRMCSEVKYGPLILELAHKSSCWAGEYAYHIEVLASQA